MLHTFIMILLFQNYPQGDLENDCVDNSDEDPTYCPPVLILTDTGDQILRPGVCPHLSPPPEVHQGEEDPPVAPVHDAEGDVHVDRRGGGEEGRQTGEVQSEEADVVDKVMEHLRAVNWNNGIRPR